MIDPERSMGCPPMLPYAPHDGLLPSHVQPPKAGDLPLAVCDPSGNRGPLPEGDANDASEGKLVSCLSACQAGTALLRHCPSKAMSVCPSRLLFARSLTPDAAWRPLPHWQQFRAQCDLAEDASEEGSWVCFWSADASPKNRRGFVGPQRFRSYLGITKLACGSSLAAFIANDGRLYCWDWGESGNMHACSPQLLEGRHLEEMHVVDVACGGGHIVCITAERRVFTYGRGDLGQRGSGKLLDAQQHRGPDEVLFPRPARQVACGEQFSLVLTDDGQVYSFGDGSHGVLGIDSIATRWTPAKVKFHDRRVALIAAGTNHAIAVTDLGSTYTWGKNNLGQLGLGHNDDRWTPQVVSELCGQRVAFIAASDASLATTAGGSVYLWGAGESALPVPLERTDVTHFALGDALFGLTAGGALWVRPLGALEETRSKGYTLPSACVQQISAAGSLVMGVAPGDSYLEEKQQRQWRQEQTDETEDSFAPSAHASYAQECRDTPTQEAVGSRKKRVSFSEVVESYMNQAGGSRGHRRVAADSATSQPPKSRTLSLPPSRKARPSPASAATAATGGRARSLSSADPRSRLSGHVQPCLRKKAAITTTPPPQAAGGAAAGERTRGTAAASGGVARASASAARAEEAKTSSNEAATDTAELRTLSRATTSTTTTSVSTADLREFEAGRVPRRSSQGDIVAPPSQGISFLAEAETNSPQNCTQSHRSTPEFGFTASGMPVGGSPSNARFVESPHYSEKAATRADDATPPTAHDAAPSGRSQGTSPFLAAPPVYPQVAAGGAWDSDYESRRRMRLGAPAVDVSGAPLGASSRCDLAALALGLEMQREASRVSLASTASSSAYEAQLHSLRLKELPLVLSSREAAAVGSELVVFQKENTDLRKALYIARQDASDLESDKNSLLRELRSLRTDLTQTKAAVSEKEEALESLEVQLTRQKKHIDRLKTELEDEAAQNHKDLKQMLEKLNTAESQRQQMQQQLQEAHAYIHRLEAERQNSGALSAEVEKLKKALSKEASEKDELLRQADSAIADWQASYTTLQAEAEEAAAKLKRTEEEAAVTKLEFEQRQRVLEDEKRTLLQKLDDSEEERLAAQAERQAVKALKEQNENFRKNCEEQSGELATLKRAEQRLRRDLDELKDERANAQVYIAKLQGEVEKLSKEITARQETIEELQHKLLDREEETSRLCVAQEQSVIEVHTLKEAEGELQLEIDSLKRALKLKDETIKRHEEQISEEKNRANTSAVLQGQLEDMTQELSISRENESRTTAHLREAQQSISLLQEKAEEATETMNWMQKKFDELQNSSKAEITRLEQQNEQLSALSESLKSTNKGHNEEAAEEAWTQVCLAVQPLADLRLAQVCEEVLEKNATDAAAIEEKLSEAQEELKEKTHELTAVNASLAKAKEVQLQIEALEKEFGEKVEMMRKMEKTVAENKAEITHLRDRNSELLLELSRQEERANELLAQNDRLTLLKQGSTHIPSARVRQVKTRTTTSGQCQTSLSPRNAAGSSRCSSTAPISLAQKTGNGAAASPPALTKLDYSNEGASRAPTTPRRLALTPRGLERASLR
ncbi:uncharacterized protein LOC34621195 [Cyclospora cayetanensis]|uniref:Uncharacterized protein LOC34621195 n=1 Tax=Cyclospora cayetanensis TaxID=88456 RepID=A0A6P6RQ28_9EIME|nr:uncharacterized protein LOC34621195 [Cyclospora cayetanensis]